MVRIEGADLPSKKRIEYGLTYVYGIGLKTSQEILTKLNIDFNTRVENLTTEEIGAIQREVSKNYVTEGELRKEIMLNIRRLKDIKSYRGLRHLKGLPVRGQRTRTNARTRKGPRGASIALKKKVTKK